MRGKVGREEQQVARPTPQGEATAAGQGALWDAPALPVLESRLRGSDGVKNGKYFEVKTGNAFFFNEEVCPRPCVRASLPLGEFPFLSLKPA